MRTLLLPSWLAISCCVLTPACGQDPGAATRPDEAEAAKVRTVNHLAGETSPYLLQHVHNPVDWYPWGPVALARAKELDRPIFLSIGYSACHWCHVMEHESFEDEAIAKTLNENFVCIKVDREERPDLDEIYMAAVQAITRGSGGWPMSVFMTPERQPFFGGTYWPPTSRAGHPGFDRVLEFVIEQWSENREKARENASRLTEYIQGALATTAEASTAELPTEATLAKFVEQSVLRFDSEHGGFAQAPRFAPKFPHASELVALLSEARRSEDPGAKEVVLETLDAMAAGGIYDQIGGGFHRYSTDREWLVPHFEKMLYDNAQLVLAYGAAWIATQKPLYAKIVRETLDYLLREMTDTGGAFWSTTDADSEGVEGKFFVWGRQEFDAVAGDDAEAARLRWGVSDRGNWDGHNVLHLASTFEAVAKTLEIEVDDARARVGRARDKLYAARLERIPPGTDDKVVTAWNGMAISAMATGYRLFDDQRYLDAGRRAADYILREMRTPEGRLLRTSRGGKAHLQGYLEDHAQVAVALLDLFECDFDPRWLREAKALLETITERFAAADGSFYFTADDHEELLARTKNVMESSTPSGIALAAHAFLRAGLLLGDEAMYERGLGVLRAHLAELDRVPMGCPSLVQAAQFALGDPLEVVLVGAPDDPNVLAMLRTLRSKTPVHHVTVLAHDQNREGLRALAPALFAGKDAIDGAATAYVCRRGACEAPITDPGELARRFRPDR